MPRRGRLGVHEGGAKVTGKKVTELKPGTYWWNRRWSEVFDCNIKRKVCNLPEQTLTTSDSQRVRVGGILIYHITNVVAWLVENEDPEHGIETDAARVLRDFIRSKTFDEVQGYSPAKRGEDDLTKDAQGELGQVFGVRIRHLGMVSFVKTRAIDLTHSGMLAMLTPEPVAADSEEE